MSGTSSVGNAGVYQADDQRTSKDSEEQQRDRYHEGQKHSHKANDSKDQRSIANRLAREEKREHEEEEQDKEAKLSQIDPTLPAKSHGNEPSKGAKIDAEIAREEEEILRKKGANADPEFRFLAFAERQELYSLAPPAFRRWRPTGSAGNTFSLLRYLFPHTHQRARTRLFDFRHDTVPYYKLHAQSQIWRLLARRQGRKNARRAAGRGLIPFLQRRRNRILGALQAKNVDGAKMAEADPQGSMTASGWDEGRERGTRRRKMYGYLKAANELRQSYQSQWVQPRDEASGNEEGLPGAFPDVEIVRSGEEEMLLFPSYARKHIKRPKTGPPIKPGATDDIANPSSGGDAEYWKQQWAQYEDENAVVDVDVRGWIYTPHKGAITRKNRLLIAVARRLSGVPAPASSPGASRDSSRHSSHREERSSRHEEEAASREAQSIVRRGEGEAEAAWRGSYSEDPSRPFNGDSPHSTRSSSPVGHNLSSDEPFPGRLSYVKTDSALGSDNEDRGTRSLTKRNTWNQPANMSKEELARANVHLMTRLRPFMHLPLAGAPITVFFFNDQKSQSRSINTNESGHFTLRASLDFVPTSIRVLASENLSATEKITVTDPRGVSLISDIDDTIKHSAIAGGAKEIFTNTFIRELGDLTIKGVKEWYSKLASIGVQLHYVSNSPWQLYPLLRSYFTLAGLPSGSFHLKQYSGMLQGIFEPAAERKKGSLEKIMRDFPERQFILVGDSGEADLEVYTDIVTANPGRILGVFIRDVTSAEKRAFFDQSTGHPLGAQYASMEDECRRGAISEAPDAREDGSLLQPRDSRPAPKATDAANTVQDLIDFDEDVKEDGRNEVAHYSELHELQSNDGKFTKSPPPTRPSKPLSLRSHSNTHARPTNHERAVSTAASQTSSPGSKMSTQRPTPPPKPRRASTSIHIPQSQRAPFSSDRQNRQRHPPPPLPTTSKAAHTTQEEEGYATSARRHLSSGYNALPSARTLWSNSPHAANSLPSTPTQETANFFSAPRSNNNGDHGRNPPASSSSSTTPSFPPTTARLSTRRNISSVAHSFASNRLSWNNATGASGGDPAAGGGGDAAAGTPYNKKEEVWRRRWARAEELMRRERVLLRSWRVGSDAMEDCVRICEEALKRIKKGRKEEGGEGGR